jgi:hypothetical protein
LDFGAFEKRVSWDETMSGLSLRGNGFRGVSRQDFLRVLRFDGLILGLPGATAAIAEATEKVPRP